MIDIAIVLIGTTCFASILVGRHLFLGSQSRIEEAGFDPSRIGTDHLLRQRKFTRFMHANLTIASAAIVLVLLSQAPRVDPSLTASVDPAETLAVN